MGMLLSPPAGNPQDSRRGPHLGMCAPVVLLDGLFRDLGQARLTGDVGPSGDGGDDCPATGAPLARAGLAGAFLAVAASRANHPAVVTGSASFSYQAVADAAHRVAACLRQQCRLSPGGRVLLMLANGPEYLAAFYGTLLASGVAVPLPVNIEASRLARCDELCEPQVVLATSEIAARRREPVFALASPWDECRHAVHEGPCERSDRDAEPLLAMILFTSGSSGEPKGVMLSHENLLSNARSILAYLPIATEDRALAILPFYHAFGNSVLQTHVLRGGTLVVDGSPAFPVTIVEALRRHEITSLSAVPEVYSSLLANSDLSGASLPALKYVAVAGGALSPPLARELASRIAPAELFVMYGQTEATARLAYLPPAKALDHPGAIGRAIPGVTLRVVDEEGSEVQTGVVGELEARGPNVMLGYWRDPAATEAVIRRGWLRTGDLASADPSGVIYLRGRRSQLVKVQGIRLHPSEIEEVVAGRWPACRAIVVPYQQADLTRLALYVVPGAAERPSIDDLRRQCLRELPRPKVPAYIEVLEGLPLNAALKVDRAALSRRAEAVENQAACQNNGPTELARWTA